MQRVNIRQESFEDAVVKASTPTRPAEYRSGVNAVDDKGIAAPLSNGSLLRPCHGRSKLYITVKHTADADTVTLIVLWWQAAADGTRVCMGRSTHRTIVAATANDMRGTTDTTGTFVAAAEEVLIPGGISHYEVRVRAIGGGDSVDLVTWLA